MKVYLTVVDLIKEKDVSTDINYDWGKEFEIN